MDVPRKKRPTATNAVGFGCVMVRWMRVMALRSQLAI